MVCCVCMIETPSFPITIRFHSFCLDYLPNSYRVRTFLFLPVGISAVQRHPVSMLWNIPVLINMGNQHMDYLGFRHSPSCNAQNLSEPCPDQPFCSPSFRSPLAQKKSSPTTPNILQVLSHALRGSVAYLQSLHRTISGNPSLNWHSIFVMYSLSILCRYPPV